jgi:hypothetical protein
MKKFILATLLISVQVFAAEVKPTISAGPYGPGKVVFLKTLNCSVPDPMVFFRFEGNDSTFVAKIEPNFCRTLYIYSANVGQEIGPFTFYIAGQEIVAFMLHDSKINPEGRLEIRPIE